MYLCAQNKNEKNGDVARSIFLLECYFFVKTVNKNSHVVVFTYLLSKLAHWLTAMPGQIINVMNFILRNATKGHAPTVTKNM